MSLGEFTRKLKSGFAEGLELGDKAGKKIAAKKLTKAQDILDDYIDYDPRSDPGGALSKGKGVPTSRDMFGVLSAMQEDFAKAKKEMRSAKRYAGDPEWSNSADEVWAKKLSQGFSKYVNMAAAAVESGDNELAERALNHAGGLMPTGGTYSFKVNDKGQIVAQGVDEVTGAVIPDKVLSGQDLRVLAASAGDPAKYLELVSAQMADVMKLRKSAIDEHNSQSQRITANAAETNASVNAGLAPSRDALYRAQATSALSEGSYFNEATRAQAEQRQAAMSQSVLLQRMLDNASPEYMKLSMRYPQVYGAVFEIISKDPEHGGFGNAQKALYMTQELIKGASLGDPDDLQALKEFGLSLN